VGAGVQTGMERAREVADGERSSTQSSGAADDGAAERRGRDSSTASAEGDSHTGDSGDSSEKGQQDGNSTHQQIPELFAPGRLLYLRKESGASNKPVIARHEYCVGGQVAGGNHFTVCIHLTKALATVAFCACR
jgi:hypothetical protein